ncbi:probable protein phosphatase 2C T23F11.1 isoform X1 [Diachasma alloeum]|uniref:probable protein phosphatase 2C T23F11.1 isoform X1 n=2 Tax=Diachasma alloeum TaxID=454923 RepID=UPI0007382C4E|nr:probable protein phosphatase 2C T23F11.1 isoform X1 [Diachasma alloeum]
MSTLKKIVRKMGQTLSEPVTTKTSACCRDSNFLVGSSCMQGWRIKMEDCHVHILALPDDPEASFFAVYDGHGGATMSLHAGKHLHEYITRTPEYKEGRIVEAMEQGFLELDKAMQADAALRADRAGTTVIAVLIKDNILYCANAGDSRAVASVHGEAVSLSRDHKPFLEDERKRIEAAGGWVEFNRVNGHLALSRALGDFKFKWNNHKSAEEQIVTAFPEVQKFEITDDWEFVILACDGIWDVMSSEEVVEFLRESIATARQNDPDLLPDAEAVYPEEICEELINRCLAPDALMGTGCDNMTIVLVCLLHEKPSLHLELQCQRVPRTSADRPKNQLRNRNHLSGSSSDAENDNIDKLEENEENSEEEESANSDKSEQKNSTGERLVEKILSNLWPDPTKK